MPQNQNMNKKNKNSEIRRYCCSNPNCHKVFSRPKIIKYYVCPSCQTIIDLASEKVLVHPILRQKHALIKEPPKLRKKKVITQTEKQSELKTEHEINATEPPLIQPEKTTELAIVEKAVITELEIEPAKKESSEQIPIDFNEKLQTEKHEINEIEQPLIQPEKNVELAMTEKPIVNEPETETGKTESSEFMGLTLMQRLEAMVTETGKEKETANSSSDVECSHYLGYLNQRVKGETIPETCIVCPKSIECLLSESNTSKESLKEIKKWYSFKR